MHDTVPIQSVKAQLFMQRWGLEKFQKIFFRIQMSFVIAAFRKWRATIEHDKHEEKRSNYMKLKASKNLKQFSVINAETSLAIPPNKESSCTTITFPVFFTD